MPFGWIFDEASPADQLKKAFTEDGDSSDSYGLGDVSRIHVKTMLVYNPLAPGVPVNGMFIATSVMLTLLISRGSLELASASPNERWRDILWLIELLAAEQLITTQLDLFREPRNAPGLIEGQQDWCLFPSGNNMITAIQNDSQELRFFLRISTQS
ncbi:uncharacterized protein EAE97_010217 [Botrytis byssoidea]|uniref:Uncharacterized protein n=1 Tax=Botrytis byssoidea TaxID=139641 RepID=A0A9P5HY34_9HELO|nr:uncharacterized protein EAE97_010217 [Botrytis byssoidea]KAF7926708.1 hypothetical protein EAE97_010217 [Botrytis byssoidea]